MVGIYAVCLLFLFLFLFFNQQGVIVLYIVCFLFFSRLNLILANQDYNGRLSEFKEDRKNLTSRETSKAILKL